MWQFGQGCLGIKEACAELNTPVIGGNVSLYNETNGKSVFPTPSIAMVGVNEDQHKVLMSAFQKEGNVLYLVGESRSEFGGSLYMKELYNVVAGTIPAIDYNAERALWNLVIEANKKGLLAAAKDCSSGGAAIALAKMACVSDKGVNASISVNDTRDIFAESMSRAIIEVAPENCKPFEAMVGSMACEKIGTVGGREFIVNDVKMNLSDMQNIYYGTFQKVIEGDL
jgi:phosphoribosylformylglycinamidine synthase subunit PurL